MPPRQSTVRRRRGWSSNCLCGWFTAAVLLFLASGCVTETDAPSDATSSEETQLPSTAAEEDEDLDVVDDDRSVSRRLDDASISARARLALVEERALRPFDFETEVIDGRIVLRGEVATEEDRRRAAEVVRRIDGVRDVINEVAALEVPEVAEADGLDVDPDADTTRERTDPPLAESRPSEAETPESPPADSREQAAPAESAEEHHVVRSGESLWTISRQYGTSVDQIRRLNNLSSDRLRPGQRLRVK